jgi:DNA polymerase V
MKKTAHLHFYSPDTSSKPDVWLAGEGISAGFPSPADDFKEVRISLDKAVVKNEAATFYARVAGQSMVGAGLDDGDLLVIDRSLEPTWVWNSGAQDDSIDTSRCRGILCRA